MYSIAVANPFSPRPDGIYGGHQLSKIPSLSLDYDWRLSNTEYKHGECTQHMR